MYNISILCPTRNRLKFVFDMIVTALDTAKYPELIEFVLYVDDDDNSYTTLGNRVSNLYDDEFIKNIKIIKGKRIVLSEMWNTCYENSDSDIFMHCGDDIRFRTENWDKKIIDKFNSIPDKIAFLYGDDGTGATKNAFGTHGFLHKNWINTLGYFVPPYFSSDFNDTWLNEVGHLINRHFFVDIYTEHMHPIVGKHTWDQTHKERLERGKQDNVLELYKSMEDERIKDSQKLQQFIDNFSKE